MSEIQEIRKSTGMSQSQFADYFGFNLRTLQNWEIERVQIPQYVVPMIQRILILEKKENVNGRNRPITKKKE